VGGSHLVGDGAMCGSEDRELRALGTLRSRAFKSPAQCTGLKSPSDQASERCSATHGNKGASPLLRDAFRLQKRRAKLLSSINNGYKSLAVNLPRDDSKVTDDILMLEDSEVTRSDRETIHISSIFLQIMFEFFIVVSSKKWGFLD
jgi:hypothetical protein